MLYDDVEELKTSNPKTIVSISTFMNTIFF